MKSVVIVRPPYRVGHLGRGAPQLTMREAIEQYGDAEAGRKASSVPSGTGSAEMSLDVPEAIEEASPPARQPSYHHLTMCLARWQPATVSEFGWPQNVYIRTCVRSEGERPRQKLTRKK